MKTKSFNLRVIDAVINYDGVRCNQEYQMGKDK